MAFNLKRKLYESVPLKFKQTIGLIPFSWIAGKEYRKTCAIDGFFKSASRKAISDYQKKTLGDTLAFTVNQVPKYKYLQSTVEKYSPFDALKEFPIVDKETIQQEIHHYLPKDFKRIPHYEVTTGGTSGNQLKLYLDDQSQAVENAFQHRLWKRVGYSIRKRRATFRGVSFPNLKPGIYWQYNPIYNEIQFSPFHMNDKTLPSYIDQIAMFKPEFLYGYPSAIDMLAEYVLREKIQRRVPKFSAALLISEGVGTSLRNRIEKAFDTRVFSFYGHTERVIMGGECEKTTAYHHFPDYGILEIIDDNGNACNNEGERGELIGTGFLNRCMPLIRYRTGDYATRLAPKCECGLEWDRFTDVEGRWKQDMLIGKNGSKVSTAALNMHGPLFDRVVRYQYYQDTAGVCTIKTMVTADFSDKDKLAIESAYKNKLGDEILFKVKIVDEIDLTARGKLKMLESHLKN